MNRLTLTIPRLYADHHVTKVRHALLSLNGVEQLYASAAFKEVTVDYDPDKISSEALLDALLGAGYPPGEPEVLARTPDYTPDPAWDALAPRLVTTDPLDRQMSGEFRRY